MLLPAVMLRSKTVMWCLFWFDVTGGGEGGGEVQVEGQQVT